MNGIVIEGFGRGNVPPQIVESIQFLINKGVSIIISSRVPKGRPFATYPYLGGAKQLVEMGCVLSPHLNSQKARILLMFALSLSIPIKNLTL
jgi:L-asparaginase